MKRSKGKKAPATAAELADEELGDVAGAGSDYTNTFQCIPDSVGTTDGSQTDPQIMKAGNTTPTR